MDNVPIKAVEEMRKLDSAEFRGRVVQGIVLGVPGLFPRLDDFRCDGLTDSEREAIRDAFVRAGITAPADDEELEATMQAISKRAEILKG